MKLIPTLDQDREIRISLQFEMAATIQPGFPGASEGPLLSVPPYPPPPPWFSWCSSCSVMLRHACVTEHMAQHVFQRFASSNYPQTGPFGFPAEGFMWIGLVSTCSSADRVSEGGGILMSRSGLLFGTRLGAQAPLVLNILLKHLFILMQPRLAGFSSVVFCFSSMIFHPPPPILPFSPPPLGFFFSPLALISAPSAGISAELRQAVMEG